MLRNKVLCLALAFLSLCALPQSTGAVTGRDKREDGSHDRLGTYVQSSESRPYYCHVEKIPTSWAFVNSPVRIEYHEVYVSEIGNISALLSLRNEGAARIVGIVLVVEYFDKQNHLVDEVPIEGRAKGVGEGLRPPLQ